jgi:hypothetical protein
MLVVGQPSPSWPPPWDPAAGPPPGAGGEPTPPRGYPPPTWPSQGQLDYTKSAVTALLLVLALPWLAYKLVTNPGEVLAGAGRQHIKPNS